MDKHLALAAAAALTYITSVVGYNINDGHPSWVAFLIGLALGFVFYKCATHKASD